MNQQLSFPNISFQETLVGPVPFTTSYRNRVGIAGIFRRGPRGAVRVTNRQDAAYLYGDDNSPGAIAIRQVLLQGATDIVVSRATPQPTAATLDLKFSNVLPTNQAQIGFIGNIQQFNQGNQVQTTGIKLDVRYVGESFETVRAAGAFNVKQTSALPASVSYNGLGLFEYVAEEYLKGDPGFVVATQLTGRSNTIGFSVASTTTYALNDEITLTALSNVDGVPTAGQIYVLPNGMQITIDNPTTTATVTKNPGTLTAGVQSARQIKTLQIASLRTNLAVDSYLYFSNANFKLTDPADPSNSVVSLTGVLSSTSAGVVIAQGATPSVEQIIAASALVSAPATYTPVTGSIEDQIQWMYADRTLEVNQALIANIKPGRLLYSASAVVFNATSSTPLTVLSVPADDPTNPSRVRFLVKGQIATALSNGAVHLYETSQNLYIFSSTFRTNSGNLPAYVKSPNANVTMAADALSGAVSLSLTSIPYRVDPGFLVDFPNGSQFTVTAQANASVSPASLTGTLAGPVSSGDIGVLSNPLEYKFLQTSFTVNERNALVDSFVIATEAVQASNFDSKILYEREDGVIFAISSGIDVDLPGISTSNKIAFLKGGTFNVPVAYASVATGSLAGFDNFPVGMTASQILTELKEAIELDVMMMGLLREPTISTTLNPPVLSLATNYTGVDANRIRATLTRAVTGTSVGVTADDLLFNATNIADSNAKYGSELSFSGAISGSQASYQDFYSADSDPLLRVVALSEGSYGNKLRVTLTPGRDGQFTLFVLDEDSSSYQNVPGSETMTLSTRDVATDGLFNASANSRLVRCYYLPVVDGKPLTEIELNKVPVRLAPSYGDRIPVFNTANQSHNSFSLPLYAQAAFGDSYLQNVYLKEGQDTVVAALPASEKAAILRQAVQELEGVDIAILYCAGFDAGDRNYSGVTEEVVGQVNRSTVLTGLRIGIIQAPRNLSGTQALSLASAINNNRVVLVGGHTTMSGVPGFNNTPGAGFYTGLLAANPPEISPAASGEGMLPNGVVSVDSPATTPYLDATTRARTEILFYDAGVGAYKFLNGLSTTSNYNDRYVSVRRMADQILHDLYTNLVWVRSNRNTTALRSQVAVAVDAYLQSLTREGRISSFRNTIVNESNNTPITISQGILNIAILYTPIYPADFIKVNVTREIADSLSLQTQ